MALEALPPSKARPPRVRDSEGIGSGTKAGKGRFDADCRCAPAGLSRSIGVRPEATGPDTEGPKRNDFDFHYAHYVRHEELIKDAENGRLARSRTKAAKETRRGGRTAGHDGVARRVARALGRGDADRRNEQAAAS